MPDDFFDASEETTLLPSDELASDFSLTILKQLNQYKSRFQITVSNRLLLFEHKIVKIIVVKTTFPFYPLFFKKID